MRSMNIVDFLKSISFDYDHGLKSYIVPRIIEIGDFTAIRELKRQKNSKFEKYRKNYERALLMVALARTFHLSNFLEFGTGRGFVCASLLALGKMDIISTIDKQSPDKAKFLIEAAGLNSNRINYITADANKMKPGDLKHDYDLVFIDAQHDGESVKLNYDLVKTKLKDRSVIVFDDYRRKFKSVKNEIDRMPFKYKLLIHTDGWIIDNYGIQLAQDADEVIDATEYGSGKEFGSGMVICSDTVSF